MGAGRQPLAVRERIALASRFFRISFDPLFPNVVAELQDEAGSVVQTAPAVTLAGVTTCAFDLARVPPGAGYTAHFAAGGVRQQVGFEMVREMSATPGQQLAATSFSQDGRDHAVALTVEPGTHAVCLALDQPVARSAVGPFPRYSVVAPVYKVAAYLDDFFASLVAQTIGFRENIEVVAVDDGSPDDSAAIIERWRREYPDNIVLIRKENGGAASARNAGLAVARGEFVSFADPDDIFCPGYFASVEMALRTPAASHTAIVACRVVYFDEATRCRDDSHPLRFRFTPSLTVRRIGDLDRNIQAAIHNTVISAAALRAFDIRFDERLTYGFEDTHLLGRLLARIPASDIYYAAEAIYLYRRRADASAVTDQLFDRRATYLNRLRHGHLALLVDCAALGRVRPHIQLMVLYSLSWLVQHALAAGPKVSKLLGPDGRHEHLDLIDQILAHLDDDVIASYGLAGVPFLYPVGLLSLKGRDASTQVVEITGADRASGEVNLRFWTRGTKPALAVSVDGMPWTVAATRGTALDYLGRPFVHETTAVGKLPPDGTVTVTVEGRHALIAVGGTRRESATVAEIFAAVGARSASAPAG